MASMASESPEPPDLNEGDSPRSKSPVAPVRKENLDCGGKDALDVPVVAQVTTSVEPKADVQDISMKTAVVGDIPGKSEIEVGSTADDSPYNNVGIRHAGPAGIAQLVDRGLMGGPVGEFSVAENVEEMTMRNTGKRLMTDQEMPSSSSNPAAQVPKPRPSQGEFGKILQISQWSLTHRIRVCEILQDSGQHWRMSIRSRHRYAKQSHKIVTSRTSLIEPPSWQPAYPLDGFDSDNWESNLEKLEVEMEKQCFQSWPQLTTDLKSRLGTLRYYDEKERWYVACREKGFQAQEIFQAVEEGNLEAFKTRMGEIGIEYWTLHPREYRGATPLHWAALHGQEDMVSCMLEEIQNWTTSTDTTGMSDLVKVRDVFGFTPLHMVLFPTLWPTYRYPEDALEDIIMDRDELARTCSLMMDSLFKMGATLDAISGDEKFRIITANMIDDSRAYFVASPCYSMRIGIHVTIEVYPLALAICIAHPSLIGKFVEKLGEAAFEPITTRGENVLHLVAGGGSAAIFERERAMASLLNHSNQYSHKAKIVNRQDNWEKTPLHIAIASGNHECVRALLESPGIEKDISDRDGHTPYSIASKLMMMSTKTGVVRDMVDFYREHCRKFWDEKYILMDMPMSGFNCKPGRFSRKDCDDIATKIFSLVTLGGQLRDFSTTDGEDVNIFSQVDQGLEVKCSAKQFRKILQMSQWSLTYRIHACKLLQQPFVRQMLDPHTKEYAEQSVSFLKMNLQSDGNALFTSIIGEDSDSYHEPELVSQDWAKLASQLQKTQDNLRENDTHERWYKAFEGKAFKPHEIFEAVELNFFSLARWMMNQVTESVLETNCAGITPGEYRGATPLHWAVLHGNSDMVKLMIEEANKLEGEFKAAPLMMQDEFGFKPIHMAILSSFMDKCFPRWDLWDLADLDSLLFPNSSEDVHPIYRNEHAYIGGSSKPHLFELCYENSYIKICDSTFFDANKVLSLIELGIYIAKEEVVKDLMVGFKGFVKPSNGDTILHFAARGCNSISETIMNLVLSHLHLQPDMLNSRNKDRETPLHIAILRDKMQLVAALLRCHYIQVDVLKISPNGGNEFLIEHILKNHPQDQRHMQLLHLSQWSLRHRILAIQMFIENENDKLLKKFRANYMKQCRLVAGGDGSSTEEVTVAELTDIANKLRTTLEGLSEYRYNNMLQQGFTSIEEGDYPRNMDQILYEIESDRDTRDKLDKLLQRHSYYVQVSEFVGLPEYKGANWFHWAVLHGRVDMVDLIYSKLKAIIMSFRSAPDSDSYGIDTEKQSADRKLEIEARSLVEFETQWTTIVDGRDDFGFTPLHLAAFPSPWLSSMVMIRGEDGTQKDVELVEKLCEYKFLHCASGSSCVPRIDFRLWDCTTYGDDHFPVKGGIYPIQLALHMAPPCIVEKLLEKFPDDCFGRDDSSGTTVLHDAKAWNALTERLEKHQWERIDTILLKLLDSPSNSKAVNVRSNDRDTPLHKAVRSMGTKWVKVLLQCEHIKFNLRDKDACTPREVALKRLKEAIKDKESAQSCQFIRSIYSVRPNKTPRDKEVNLWESIIELIHSFDPESKPQERESLYRERQIYVDAANAILVGAALIASASFGAWLAPPFGYQAYYSPEFQDTSPDAPPGTYESYVAIKQHWMLQMFWVFNSLAFFVSLATVIAGADAAIPWQEAELKVAMASVRRAVKLASALLGVAIVFVICSFATLGFAILPPIAKYKINMWCTLAVGVVLCIAVLIRLLRKLVITSARPTHTAHITHR